MFANTSPVHRLILSTVFALGGAGVTLVLATRTASQVLKTIPADNVLNRMPQFEPQATLFLLKEIFASPQSLWPAVVVFMLGILISVLCAALIHRKVILSSLRKQNLDLDEDLRHAQKKWRSADLTNKDLYQQISTVHERISDCFLFVSHKGEVLHTNTNANQFFERALDLNQEVKGTQLSLLIPGYQETDFGKALEATVQKKRPVKTEIEITRRVWIQARFYPSVQGVFVYFADVSRQKSTKVKVATSTSLLRQILDSALQATAITDKNWIYVATNKQWLTQFKLNNDEILDRYFGQVLPDALPNLQKISQKVRRGDVYKSNEQPVKINGKEEWVMWEVRPWWDDEGTHGGFIVLATFTTELRRRREQAARHREKEKKLAYYDNLTGLANRQLFFDQLNQALAHAYKTENTVALMFLDLDGFKPINDEIGHDAGDALLREVAQRLTNTVRGTDTVARLGGDEFTIILNDVHSIDNIEKISEKIIKTISQPYKLGNTNARVTTSLGISLYPEHGSTAVELIKSSDSAMYKAKNSGKNQYCVYQEENKEIFPADQNEVAKILSDALYNGELELHYQPQTEGVYGRVVGVEALLRWRHPQHGLLSPADFLPQAESTGLIIDIGKWTLEEACLQNMKWRKEGLGEFAVTVNLSPHQFREAGMIEAIDTALDKSSLPADALGIEISEMLMNEYPQTTLETVNTLKLKGIRILVDDYGVQQSNSSNLGDFPVDTIKINQRLVKAIDGGDESKAIIKNIISLATDLEIDVIGEGVENTDQAEFLSQHGCKYIQGFLSGRPILPSATADFLHDKNLTTRD